MEAIALYESCYTSQSTEGMTSFDDRLDADIREILILNICMICNQGQGKTASDVLGPCTYKQAINVSITLLINSG